MDTFIYGILVMVIGLVIVFIGLIMIIILTKGLRLVNMFKKKDVVEKQPAAKAKVKQAIKTELQQPAEVSVPQADNNELIAVITAAIAAWDGDQFVIRSVRRVNHINVWSRTGRAEQIAKRI